MLGAGTNWHGCILEVIGWTYSDCHLYEAVADQLEIILVRDVTERRPRTFTSAGIMPLVNSSFPLQANDCWQKSILLRQTVCVEQPSRISDSRHAYLGLF